MKLIVSRMLSVRLNRIVLLLLILVVALGSPPRSTHSAPNQDSVIVLRVFQAEALNHNTDNIFPWWSQQDFYAKASINGGPLITGPQVDQRDFIEWTPPFVVTATVLANSLTIPLHIELWDDDDIDPDDQFDINTYPGRSLDLFFNTCTLTLNGGGITTQPPGRLLVPAGQESDPARVAIEVTTQDGRPFSPNDVAIADATPVQVVYHPRAIIEDKATALMVRFTSSWSVNRAAHVTVSMSDGFSTVNDVKDLSIPPEGLTAFFFDGSGTSGPFYPKKYPNNPRLTYSVQASVDGEPPASPAPPWENCYASNNAVSSASLPVVTTYSPTTVYVRWDWYDPGGGFSPVYSTLPELNTFYADNNRFVKATFPISGTRSAPSPLLASTPYLAVLEPGLSLVWWNIGAMTMGIDRLVLVPRTNWWAENSAAGRIGVGGPSTIGLSLGEFGSRAVLAQTGYSQVGAHELGHTYRLSQRRCSNGGIGEDIFLAGCRDEYNFAPGDGAPFMASGFDVEGLVYPSGFNGLPTGRDVNATNLMDSTGAGPGSYNRWIDNFSYDILTEAMRNPQDPTLVSISGYVQNQAIANRPDILIGLLQPSFIFDGAPDLPETKLNGVSGNGALAVVLQTPAGMRTYRFDVTLDPEGGTKNEAGFFSFAIPWDPATTEIQLYGPSDLKYPQNSQDILLTTLVRSASGPKINSLVASHSGGANQPQAPAAPILVGPGEAVKISWETVDPDSATLHAILLLDPPDSASGYTGYIPVALNETGNAVVIPYQTLAGQPGVYGVKLIISDGVNTATYEAPGLFSVKTAIYLPLVRR